MKHALPLFLCGPVLLALPSCAPTSPPPPNRVAMAAARFDEMDKNHDGKLDYAEFLKTRAASRARDPRAAFKSCDRNHDGYLTKDEIRDFFASHRAGG